MSYIVETYEHFESRSDPSAPVNFLYVGTYSTADDAVEVAKNLIRKSIAGLVNEGSSLENAISSYRIYGEIPVVRGEPCVDFNPLKFLSLLTGNARDLFEFFGVKP